ncbi:hypothetical protein RND81_01G149100 [Saponaria officinalis]|uniref:DOMON domain-containing protein n=1 Tax=Saponaria officinalis TaxID=3572 RepID=A0AAW1NIV1_SAPOF
MNPIKTVMAISIISLFSHNVYSQFDCKSMTFSNNKTFVNCKNLPTLNSILHWTHDAATSTLSMAFTAPSKDGWVAWAINPNGTGMVGAQALMAFKPIPTGAVSVNTLDIRDYHSIEFGPISYNVTDTSGEESSGNVTVFGTWALPEGQSKISMVWQAGPVVHGAPIVHAKKVENFNSKAIFDLSTAIEIGSRSNPASAPWTFEAAKLNDAVKGVVSVFSILGSFLVLLF